MTGTHGTNAGGDEQSNQPQTRAVAAVLALSDRPPADQDTREMVAEWVDARDSSSATVEHENRAGGDAGGLAGLTRGVEQ